MTTKRKLSEIWGLASKELKQCYGKFQEGHNGKSVCALGAIEYYRKADAGMDPDPRVGAGAVPNVAEWEAISYLTDLKNFEKAYYDIAKNLPRTYNGLYGSEEIGPVGIVTAALNDYKDPESGDITGVRTTFAELAKMAKKVGL